MYCALQTEGSAKLLTQQSTSGDSAEGEVGNSHLTEV